MLVTIDFETFYSREYSLSRMSEAEYILDPRFEALSLAIKIDHEDTCAFDGEKEIRTALKWIDWDRAMLCSHNARFDASILAWRFGVTAKFYADTLAMARPTVWPYTHSVSLKAVADFLKLPAKGNEVIHSVGKHRADFSPEEWEAFVRYNKRDADICYMVFQKLGKHFTKQEFRTIDATTRMYVLPQVTLDMNTLASHLLDVRNQKAEVLKKVSQIDPGVFSSNIQFAELLRNMGVEVPEKVSPRTGKMTYALARGDREFRELCMDTSLPLEVQAILAARVSEKSTIEETRTVTLMATANLPWKSGSGWAPVPLRYYGAHTGRFSGDGGCNWQNLPRGSKLRDAVRAPDGYVIVHRDASQVEARMAAWLAGCKPQLEAFNNPERDIYCEFASGIYERQITKAHRAERHVGKTAILSLGYGCGAARFRHALFCGTPQVDIDDIDAARIVNTYRGTYPDIPALWRRGEAAMAWMVEAGGKGPASDKRDDDRARTSLAWQTRGSHLYPVVTLTPRGLQLPNGLSIQYPGLRVDYSLTASLNEYYYNDPRLKGSPRKIWGGMFLENVSQALCRIILTEIIDRVQRATGHYPFLMTHDSLDYCVPVDGASKFDHLLAREFARTPAWAPGLPLTSAGGWGDTMLNAEGH